MNCRVCQATVANGGRENLHYRAVLVARVSPRGTAHWVNNMGVTLCGKDGRRWPEVPKNTESRP